MVLLSPDQRIKLNLTNNKQKTNDIIKYYNFE